MTSGDVSGKYNTHPSFGPILSMYRPKGSSTGSFAALFECVSAQQALTFAFSVAGAGMSASLAVLCSAASISPISLRIQITNYFGFDSLLRSPAVHRLHRGQQVAVVERLADDAMRTQCKRFRKARLRVGRNDECLDLHRKFSPLQEA